MDLDQARGCTEFWDELGAGLSHLVNSAAAGALAEVLARREREHTKEPSCSSPVRFYAARHTSMGQKV